MPQSSTFRFKACEYIHPLWYLGLLLLQRKLRDQTCVELPETSGGIVCRRRNLQSERAGKQLQIKWLVKDQAEGSSDVQESDINGKIDALGAADKLLCDAQLKKLIVGDFFAAIPEDMSKLPEGKGRVLDIECVVDDWKDGWERLIGTCSSYLQLSSMNETMVSTKGCTEFSEALFARLREVKTPEMLSDLSVVLYEHLSGNAMLELGGKTSETADQVLASIRLSDVDINFLYRWWLQFANFFGFHDSYNQCIAQAKDVLTKTANDSSAKKPKYACKKSVITRYNTASANDQQKQTEADEALRRRANALCFFKSAAPQCAQRSDAGPEDAVKGSLVSSASTLV